MMKKANDGKITPFQRGYPSRPNMNEPKVGTFFNDFTLTTHGFCIVKVLSRLDFPSTIRNQLNIFKKLHKVKFSSIGQEEDTTKKGKRMMLNSNKEINADVLLEKKLNGKLKKCIANSLMVVNNMLTKEFQTQFEVKAKTLLTKEGIVGNQLLHTDGYIQCTCD